MTPAGATWWRRYWPDLLLAGVLGVVAFLVRRHGLPTDGLWLDDAVPAAGLKASSPSELLSAGVEHAGFIAVLIGWSRLTGGSDASLAYPALIAGTLGPPLLYLALRGCGYERSISALLGAALAAAATAIVYSGRVRDYTIDVLIVLGLAMVVPRLTRRSWRWQTGVAWAAAAIVVSSFSIFALIAAAVAGAIVVLHPASDLRVRIITVGAQAAATLALLGAERHAYRDYSGPSLEGLTGQPWDTFVTFHANPLRFGGNVLLHLRRLAEMFPGGPGWFATLCIVAALVGLVTIAWKGRQTIRARYLLLVLVVTFVGGLLHKFPFGPKVGSDISNGQRWSLWLVPVVALGLAAVLQGLRGGLTDRRALRIGFDTFAYLAAAAILVSAVAAKQLPYPWPGAKSATDFVESQLGPRDAVLLPWAAQNSFAVESGLYDGVIEKPAEFLPFWPKLTDRRLHASGWGLDAPTPPRVAHAVKGADRVFVYLPNPFNTTEVESRDIYANALPSLGFERQRTAHFGVVRVEIWRRGGAAGHQANRRPAAAGGRIDLKLSDLRPGWGTASTRPNFALLGCLHVPTAKTTQRAVKVTGPKAKRSAVFEVTLWPSPAAAHSAFNALRGPGAAGCIQSTLQSILLSSGLPTSVTANEVPPPPAGGNPAVAYAETVRASNGTSQFDGTVVFFIHGTASVLINGVSVGGPFPPDLLSSLVATLADRVNAATPGTR